MPVAPASARPRPDLTRVSRSRRWSAGSTNGVVVNGMRHHMIYKSSVQATSCPLNPGNSMSGPIPLEVSIRSGPSESPLVRITRSVLS